MTIYELRGAKGGVGTSTIAAALAIGISPPSYIVDLGGDQPYLLGIPHPLGNGVTDWLHAGSIAHMQDCTYDALNRTRVTVIDQGLYLIPHGHTPIGNMRADRLGGALVGYGNVIIDNAAHADIGTIDTEQHIKVLVTTSCYMAITKGVALARDWRPDVIINVADTARSLSSSDVGRSIGAPVVIVPHDQQTARNVDAGLLNGKMPATLVGLRGKIERALARPVYA